MYSFNKHLPGKVGGIYYAGKALCSSRMRKTHNTVCQPRSDCLLAARKRSSIIFSCSLNSSSFNCFAVHFDIMRAILPVASAKYSRHQSYRLRYFYFCSPIFHIYFVCDGLFMSFRRTLNGRLIAIGFPEPPA